jgi:hypothetical protein
MNLDLIMAKLIANEPINREEFLFFMARCTEEYWSEAQEHEDNPPEQLGGADRLIDFLIYFKEQCAS